MINSHGIRIFLHRNQLVGNVKLISFLKLKNQNDKYIFSNETLIFGFSNKISVKKVHTEIDFFISPRKFLLSLVFFISK